MFEIVSVLSSTNLHRIKRHDLTPATMTKKPFYSMQANSAQNWNIIDPTCWNFGLLKETCPIPCHNDLKKILPGFTKQQVVLHGQPTGAHYNVEPPKQER